METIIIKEAGYFSGVWLMLPVGEWPVNHGQYCSHCAHMPKGSPCECDDKYNEALTSSLSKAVPFEDQDKIASIVFEYWLTKNENRSKYFKREKGVYTIPPTEVEIVETPTNRDGKLVARIKDEKTRVGNDGFGFDENSNYKKSEVFGVEEEPEYVDLKADYKLWFNRFHKNQPFTMDYWDEYRRDSSKVSVEEETQEELFTRKEMEKMFCMGLLNQEGFTMDKLSQQLITAQKKIDLCINEILTIRKK